MKTNIKILKKFVSGEMHPYPHKIIFRFLINFDTPALHHPPFSENICPKINKENKYEAPRTVLQPLKNSILIISRS